MQDDDERQSLNPPHNQVLHEHPDATRLRLYHFHKRAGSLETYFEMYPDARPVEPEKRPRGRGR